MAISQELAAERNRVEAPSRQTGQQGSLAAVFDPLGARSWWRHGGDARGTAPARYDATVIPSTDAVIDWASGTWLNPPLTAVQEGSHLVVTAAEASDFWRTTAYGFIHDDGHGLLRGLDLGTAVEVTFRLDYDRQFDQAGVLVRADERHWLKAGVEVVDSVPQLGAVVTHEASDWSARPVPTWQGSDITIRVSRAADALTVRARRGDDGWQFVRLAPWPPGLAAQSGPYCCAPSRAGLRVRFTRWRVGSADARLHE